MKIFRDYTLTWWQTGMLKVSVVCIGIAIGANWPEIFVKYTALLVIVAVVFGIYLAVISFKK